MRGRCHKKIDSAASKPPSSSRSGGGNERIASIAWKVKHEIGGPWILNYYLFLSRYHRDPIDMLDFLQGLNTLSVILELEGPRL